MTFCSKNYVYFGFNAIVKGTYKSFDIVKLCVFFLLKLILKNLEHTVLRGVLLLTGFKTFKLSSQS